MHAIGILHDYLFIILHVAWPVITHIGQMHPILHSEPEPNKVVCLQYFKQQHKNFWKIVLLEFEWLGSLMNHENVKQ